MNLQDQHKGDAINVPPHLHKNALILHGTDASPEANWFHWVETFMKQKGYEVWLPQLPDSATPNVDTYNTFLFSKPDFKFNENTVLIGHSSGAVEILSLLQNLPETIVVGDVYLVSVFRDNLGWDALEGLFTEPYDFELIKTKAHSITLVHSDTDPYVPLEHAHFLAQKLNARLLTVAGQGHFNLEQSEEYHEFPLLAQAIETNGILSMKEKLTTFCGETVEFIGAQSVKDGVECDVYSFLDDDTKDLGIIRIKQGSETPKQQILKGDKTIEGFLYGKSDLIFSSATQDATIHTFSDENYGIDVTLNIGDTMQWRADKDSVIYEICYPPYEDGRFTEL